MGLFLSSIWAKLFFFAGSDRPFEFWVLTGFRGLLVSQMQGPWGPGSPSSILCALHKISLTFRREGLTFTLSILVITSYVPCRGKRYLGGRRQFRNCAAKER